jgi:hypothetical protein
MYKQKGGIYYIVVVEVIAQVGKPSKPLNYPCHICGIVGHKLMNSPRFGEMEIMFKDKGGKLQKPSQQSR